MADNQQIRHLHAFRGFAILTICAAHAWSFPIFWTGQLDPGGLTWLFQITETLFHGSTLYFAVISGLLFSKILSGKGWKTFFLGKVNNVLMPFAVVTVLMTSLNWQYALEQAPTELPDIIKFFYTSMYHLVTGQAMIHFWYMPVLAFLFVMTPVLMMLQKKSMWLFLLIIIAPLVISRSPFPDFLKPQSFIYFLGAYALGMLMGAHYETALNWIKRYRVSLIIIAVVTTLLILCLFHWDYKATGFYSAIQTFVYLQKISICCLLLHWMSAKEHQLPKGLMLLGSYSFAIYFLHVFFMWPFIVASNTLLTEYRDVFTIAPLGAANLIWAIAMSMLAAKIVKLLTRSYSRRLIGA